MFCKKILFVIIFLHLSNCTTGYLKENKPNIFFDNGYSNKGFALIYNDDLYNQKVISRKIDARSLIIFQKNLKINTKVKLTNDMNGKSIIGTVGKKSDYPSFNNVVLSQRIADELDLNINEPYIEISEIIDNSTFIAKKAKTYDEERNVAVKAPVNDISINDLNEIPKINKKLTSRKFSYFIKVADFYFYNTAQTMIKRIKSESSIKKAKIKKISDKIYRVYLGPFNNINSLQKSYNDIGILQFDNIEIIRND